MDISDLFKGFFNLPRNQRPESNKKPTREDYLKPEEPDSFDSAFSSQNPFELHQTIEKQMQHIFKSIFSDFGVPDSNWSVVPSLEWDQKDPVEQYLKPGYTQKDDDLDGQVTVNDLDRFFNKNSEVTVHRPGHFYQMVTIRTIRNPDGTVETTKTVKDHTGKEEIVTTTESGAPFSDDSLFSKYFRF